ncbi:MAG TPA: type II CAAX endopeptidase family protein [Gemmatimonadales bacterium]|nr:type II CAAX endopeptidase family protein [Gemmatimonadales bacterium]
MSTTTSTQRPAHTQSLVRRHPLISFYVLTYAVSWLLWAPLVIFGDRVPGPLAFILLLLGSLVPSTMGVLFVALLRGRSGVRTLLGRLLHARIGLRWYLAVVALTMLAPLAVGVSILMGGDTPVVDNTVFGVLFLFAFMIFPGSALGEELGWRGFVLPRMQARHSALKASLLIGILWGPWHLPLWLTGSEGHPISLYGPFVVAVVASSVFYTWLYNNTGGSLLIVVLYHAASNLPITVLITPLGGQMAQPFLIYVALTVVAAAAIVIATGAQHLSRTAHRQIEQP